jgi:phenylacetate-CoA ligase
MSESVFVEVVDAAGRPVPTGESGRVLVTSLHNFATPLLRYEIGDHAETGAACPCGRGLPVLTRILGRVRNILTLPDGRQRWPSLPVKRWAHTAPVREMQLVQESVELIVTRVVTDRELTAEEETNLLAALRQCLEFPGQMQLERVAQIPRGAGGKFEQFLSKVARPGI